MLLRYQLIIIFVVLSLTFMHLHSFIVGIADYKLNKSAFKKRKQGQTFVEWLLFSRFRQEIPKGWIVFFISLCSTYLFVALTCVFLYICNEDVSFWLGKKITLGVIMVFLLYLSIDFVLFYSREPEKFTNYDKWFKKRGNPPKKRKK